MPAQRSPIPEVYLKAISFAVRRHEGQYRKDGKTPYVSHPFRVSAILQTVFHIHDARILTAAVLHDTLEDTTTDYDDLEKEFGAEIADWVSRLSKDKRIKEDKRETAYGEQLKSAPDAVKLIKVADLLDNLLDSETQSAPYDRQKLLSKARYYLNCLSTGASSEIRSALAILEEKIQ